MDGSTLNAGPAIYNESFTTTMILNSSEMENQIL
jgi:hypothetical protein